MTNLSVVNVRIDAQLKKSAEEILSKLGISPSTAIKMFYSQIVLHNGISFDPSLPYEFPVLKDESPEELERVVKEGVESLKTRQSLTADEFEEVLKKFGV